MQQASYLNFNLPIKTQTETFRVCCLIFEEASPPQKSCIRGQVPVYPKPKLQTQAQPEGG